MKNCENCQKLTKNLKYCSRSCSAIVTGKLFPKRKIKRKCVHCDNLIRNYRSSLCENHYQIELTKKIITYKNKPLKDFWNRPGLKNLHASSKNSHIRIMARNWFKSLTLLPCANCNYNKHVELCHIKPISEFTENNTISEVNSKENLIQLCPNCHWEFDHNLLTLKQIREPRGI